MGPVVLSTHDITENQRSFELRKFFAAERSSSPKAEAAFNESLNNDEALSAYAESVVWRLGGVHCMVSLLDKGEQFFLAGALREASDEDTINDSDLWFGCSSVLTPGGLCENTLALDAREDEYPCFIVTDLSKDERFKDLPVVNGELTSYRFYAGTPITTSNGVNIGSFFIFDNTPREGLTFNQRKYLHRQAKNVMKHLEIKRVAADRGRAALMTKGFANFLEQTSHDREVNHETREGSERGTQSREEHRLEPESDGIQDQYVDPQEAMLKETTLGKIRTTLVLAAEILRSSIEVESGGVLFVDAAAVHSEFESLGSLKNLHTAHLSHEKYNETARKRSQTAATLSRPGVHHSGDDSGRHLSQGLIRSSADKHKPPKILASSTGEPKTWNSEATDFTAGTLASFIKNYPKGNIWSIDGDGVTSSLNIINEWEKFRRGSIVEKGQTTLVSELDRERKEASVLSQIFPTARQIIFLPIWDASAGRWHSGCFVWSQSLVPVFTLESELAYLSVFTNSMMVEISRLDAITANKMKSDFLGSISHEFRSPLHGILASVDFLQESILDNSQAELVSTIRHCSGTLLDTINHVLDYSKINSFEISGNQQGPISNELYQVTNLALLCEDVVEGMVAATGFRGALLSDPAISVVGEFDSRNNRREKHNNDASLEVVLDIEQRDWDFRVEAGALRRIVMNLFGNAQKFTQSGYILVSLRIFDAQVEDVTSTILSLKIRDSGRGMSSEFMERKLYHPFCQEDAFAPGVGLGLSIVWTIVNQLGGRIQVRSEQGKGTDVEVTLAVNKANPAEQMPLKQGELLKISADEEASIANLRGRDPRPSVSFARKSRDQNPDPTDPTDAMWQCIEKYCRDWFGFTVKVSGGTVLITDQQYPEYSEGQRILMIQDSATFSNASNGNGVAFLSSPIGPFKLARSIISLLDQDMALSTVSGASAGRSDMGTQTPLGSPEERTILNGIIATDHGFSQAATLPEIPETTLSQQTVDTEPIAPCRDTQSFVLRMPSGRGAKKDTKQTTETRTEATQTPTKPTDLITKPPQGLRILAVDDNDINLRLLHRSLQKRKSDTTALATNGIEAVNLVQAAKPEEPFDVIFMDISMPEMDGFEATRLIRAFEAREGGDFGGESGKHIETEGNSVAARGGKNSSRACIIALTGLASRRDRDEAEECGCDDFMTKPVSFRKVGEVLDRLSREKFGGGLA